MVKHIIDLEKCRGCGKCVELCGLELWVLVDTDDGKKKAQVTEEAADICHCRNGCQSKVDKKHSSYSSLIKIASSGQAS